jgi:hypothetical protein
MRFELMHGFWPSNGLANRPLNLLEYLSKPAVYTTILFGGIATAFCITC